MDVSSFLKWSEPPNSADSERRGSTISQVQDNISHFFQNVNPSSEAASIITEKSTSPKESKEKPSSASLQPPQVSGASSSSSLFTDKLVERLFSMAIPTTNELVDSKKLDKRLAIGKTRPSFSVPIMSKNFIQLNSRLSFPFELIDDIIRTFQWHNPVQTVTILILTTHFILTPIPLILSFPFVFLIINVLVPNFVHLHAPDNKDPILGESNPILSDGSNLKNVEFVKPAPEISREFIINMTDLQNHMLLYVKLWDFVDGCLRKFGYFVDDEISTVCYLILLTLGCFTLIFGQYLFLKFLIVLKISAIILLWGFTLTFHPKFYDYFYNLVFSEDIRYYFLGKTNKFESVVHEKLIVEELDEPQEQREVEIFEIQQLDSESKEWQLIFYLNDDFTRYSKLRINYFQVELPVGSTSLNTIKPPNENWGFTDSSWKIDLNPKEWVSKDLLQDFVTIDDETKWVYDKAQGTNDGSDQIQFRRRRWTRSVARNVDLDKDRVIGDRNTDSSKATSSGSNMTEIISQG